MNLTDLLREAAAMVTVIGAIVAFVRFVRIKHVHSTWLTYSAYALMVGGGALIIVGDILGTYTIGDTSLPDLLVPLIIAGVLAFLLGSFILLIIISAK